MKIKFNAVAAISNKGAVHAHRLPSEFVSFHFTTSSYSGLTTSTTRTEAIGNPEYVAARFFAEFEELAHTSRHASPFLAKKVTLYFFMVIREPGG